MSPTGIRRLIGFARLLTENVRISHPSTSWKRQLEPHARGFELLFSKNGDTISSSKEERKNANQKAFIVGDAGFFVGTFRL